MARAFVNADLVRMAEEFEAQASEIENGGALPAGTPPSVRMFHIRTLRMSALRLRRAFCDVMLLAW
jgi:hypothetical protein